MKKTMLLAIMLLPLLLLLSFVMIYGNPTGMAVSGLQGTPEEIPQFGPTPEERECMMACVSVGCTPRDMTCMKANGEKCQAQCNAYEPESAGKEYSCMQKCVKAGCDEVDFDCQETNRESCEKECGMIKEPEPKSEEEACIRACVRKVDPALMCGGGPEGEQGNEVCQRCAQECVHLYAGPCLAEEKLEEKKQACITCEHCYGEPVMGDSGEGYECIVDVVCKDASAEFGDEPGTGAGIFDEAGVVDRTRDRVTNVFSKAVGFFKGLFGIGEEVEEPEETFCEDDGNPCTEEVIIEGVCTHPASKIGKVCNDKDACSYDDHCVGNKCEPGGFLEDCLSACGNDKCEYGENPDICPMDCGGCKDGICRWHEMEDEICPQDCLPACGNTKCEPGEILSCLVDCSYCGDSFCGLNENPDNCAHDCPPACGDGKCGVFEMQQEFPCPVDCGTAIGNGICEGGENPKTAPQDCTYCGDKICSYIEMENKNCPIDCKTDSKNSICEGGESPENAPFDCGYCGDTYCGYLESMQDCAADCLPACGDGKCESNEIETCSLDCHPLKETKQPTCGDKNCEISENCAADCFKTCGDGICSKQESMKSCPADCKTSCFNKKCELNDIIIGCAADCPAECGDGICSGIENADSCEADCSIKQTKKTEYAQVEESCGDGFCSPEETPEGCPYDCKGICGNNICEPGESFASCKEDCSESCGNGKCETGKETGGVSENYIMCPADCGYCGDNYCLSFEAGKCALDCLPLNHCGDGKCLPDEISACPIDCEDYDYFIQPVCGNKITDGEICLNCTWDCGHCGDGICAPVEAKHCASDCFSACGNNICEPGESAKDCPYDCTGTK